MANNSKKVKAAGYATGGLAAAVLGVGLYAKGNEASQLTDEQLAELEKELKDIAEIVNGEELVDSKGNVVSLVSNANTGGGSNTWDWSYKDSEGNEQTATYHFGGEEQNETFKELKDADGNVIGVYKAPSADGQADGKLYINGKWYNNVEVKEDGTLVSNGTNLGTVGANTGDDFKLSVDGKEVTGTVGEEVQYKAICNENNEVVGYQSTNGSKETFMFDENGVQTHGMSTARENLTAAKTQVLAALDSLSAVEGEEAVTKIDQNLVNEYKAIVQGTKLNNYTSVSDYTAALQDKMSSENMSLWNKLSLGTNEVANSEVFDKVNEFLGSELANPASIGVIGLCTLAAAAVGGVAVTVAKVATSDKKKVFGATSLNSSHGSSSKSR